MLIGPLTLLSSSSNTWYSEIVIFPLLVLFPMPLSSLKINDCMVRVKYREASRRVIDCKTLKFFALNSYGPGPSFEGLGAGPLPRPLLPASSAGPPACFDGERAFGDPVALPLPPPGVRPD